MKVGMFLMLLVGLLIPMTIASKSIDFYVNTILFDDQESIIMVDSLKSVQPLKIKSMITKGVAEGSRKRSGAGSKEVAYVTLIPDICIYRPNNAKMEGQQSYMMVRNQVDYVVYVSCKYNDNLIRYL